MVLAIARRFPRKITNGETNRGTIFLKSERFPGGGLSICLVPRSNPANVRAITRKTPFPLDKREAPTQVDR